IKCDRGVPCANCIIAKRTCNATGPNSGGARQRVLISSQYEQKIDRIEDRLDGIERLLQDVIASVRPQRSEVPSLSRMSSQHEVDSTIRPEASTEEPALLFEGGSSLTAHTNLVSNLVSHTVNQTNLPELDRGIQSALSTLRHIVDRQYKKAVGNELGFSNQKPLPRGGLRELPMPPLQVVLQLLRTMKDAGPTVPWTLHCIFLPIPAFAEYCQRVYFATEDFDLGTFIVVNGGLFYALGGRGLIREEFDDPNIRADYFKYRNMCADNLVAALGSISLFMPASVVNIEALLLGTNYAIEGSRPSLAWKMSNIAAQMCQTLGYHQMPTAQGTQVHILDQERRIDALRYTYIVNKALALRLGRASAFQDYDISVPIYGPGNRQETLWQKIVAARVRHARVQGKIYEQLYSSKALVAPPEHRTSHAMALAESVKAMIADLERIKIEFGNSHDAATQDMPTRDASIHILGSQMIQYQSSLTLIYRAVPESGHTSNTFADECNEAARIAFQHHRSCMAHAVSPVAQTGYVHWTLLFAPFTPLIAIFCHAIERLDEGDLRELESFIVSLEPVCPLSESTEQLHRLAQALHNIAFLYIKAKKSQFGMQDTVPMERDFESYLTRLGLMVPATGHTGYDNVATGPPQNQPLGGWFAGNVTMMGLLEEDLGDFFP
ncbi:hypothetical protein BKA67DRAFT_519399, partial [Truncatella angustata]